jgi:hypothetical protein
MPVFAASTPMSDLGVVFGLGFAVVFFMIGLSISAAILKLSCRTAGVEAPDTGRAMIVSLLESLVGGAVYMGSTITLGFVGATTNMDKSTLGAMVGFSAVGVGFVVPAGLYVPMLRVTFSKGLFISFIRQMITYLILAALVVGILLASGKIKLH